VSGSGGFDGSRAGTEEGGVPASPPAFATAAEAPSADVEVDASASSASAAAAKRRAVGR
jgi:hypothetical protein